MATSSFVEAPLEPEILNEGRTRLISVGRKGQYVGVLGLYTTPDQKFRYQRVDLNQRYNCKTEAMRKLIDEDFQDALRQADVLSSYPRRAYVFANNAPSDATFVGAETCKNCHPKTYEKWASTGHAKAYEALVSNPKRNREFDAHCVSCHTTGFEYLGGFTSLDATPHLKGNQCENCHGPGSKHAAAPDDAVLRVAMHRDKMDFDKNQRCMQCHSEDDSPHFDFATYWPKVIHNDLDDYTDPKVHRGLTPEQMAAPGSSEKRVILANRLISKSRAGPTHHEKGTSGMEPATASLTPPAPLSRVQRLVSKYREDHQNPINHFLHVYVGWPLCALGVIALPFRPICFVYGFALGYAFMWTGHFVFERNLPTVFRHPTTPFVMAWEVIKTLLRGAWNVLWPAEPSKSSDH